MQMYLLICIPQNVFRKYYHWAERMFNLSQ